MKKRFAVRLAACFTVFAVCSAALAAQATVLTIEDAVQMAFNNNISLERNALTLQGLERAKNHAWNSFSPSLSVGGGFQMPNKPAAQGLPYDYALYGQAAVGFNISPALIAAIKTASLQFEAGELSFNEAVRSIELSVRQAFYGLLYERAYIEQQERSLETARQQYEQNRRQYQAGRISELDVLAAQVNYEQIKPSLESARTSYMNNMDLFKILIGMDVQEEVELDGTLDDFLSLGEIVLNPEEIRPPAITLLEKQLETARSTLTATRLYSYGPTISLSWGWQPTATNADEFKNWDDHGSLSIGLSVPLDCYLPWSSAADSIADAKDAVTDLELQLEDTKLNVGSNIASYLRQVNVSRSSIETCNANVNLARKSYELALEAYNRGARDFLSLQDASDTLFEAEVALLSATYNLSVTILNLENTTGIPFGTFIKNQGLEE